MKTNEEQYIIFLKQKVFKKISTELNENSIDRIVQIDLYDSHIKDNISSSFQKYYFETLNNEINFLSSQNFFKQFKRRYSLQGIDNEYLDRLENSKSEILQLIRHNSLTKLYIDYFNKALIKHGDLKKEKDLGSFFAKLVHHFLPNEYCALDNPIKDYFGLSKESFFIAFFIISEEYKKWALENKQLLNTIRENFRQLDENKILDFNLLTDHKLLDLIFWSKANRNKKVNTKKSSPLKKMKLHDAIAQTLITENRAMSTKEIADKLNISKLYTKKDKSKITDFQIHGRTKNYPNLFNRDGSVVSLIKGK
ncbi:hypothetical protein SAMN05444671_1413 [Flavobacterium sp. CF108]|uniref:hypothetical protein n=1 Tax=unclassified Flavobacterium TaxID=196869 RepID=UPI0008D59D95|nr:MULTISPECIES: hypothetical protein [unclassified Flavobacterium]SEO79117.1 hypothetical protein SAMN04487978_3640 [Flavobacterium sp. fv08]SHG76454.1 hypothetical protein SAMN05444671_1413 [Flavobacterium sp. CF108]